MEIRIEAMAAGDWPEAGRIYAQGIATGDATFQTEVPAWEAWDAAHLPSCRLVARAARAASEQPGGPLLGWAALSPVSARAVYAGVAEVSVYVAEEARGKGVGRRLLTELIAASERDGRWTLQAGIFPENRASLGLHERAGFRTVGRREAMGFDGRRWRDVLLLERRSPVVG